MPYPLYSPDLAPITLEHHRFRSEDEVKEEVKRLLKGMAAEFYDVGMKKLEHRLQKCVEEDGDYVEK